jgi:hypothetical protein
LTKSHSAYADLVKEIILVVLNRSPLSTRSIPFAIAISVMNGYGMGQKKEDLFMVTVF